MKLNHGLLLRATVIIIAVVPVFISCKKKTSGPLAPTTYTSVATVIGARWAVLNASITANNLQTSAYFEWDSTSEYTQKLETKFDSITGTIPTSVYASLQGLNPNTTYHYRAVATNSKGTVYGNEVLFTTVDPEKSITVFNDNLTYGSISDKDGNKYKTVQVGTQTWMAENLKTTRFNDNTIVPLVTNTNDWDNLTGPGLSWYNQDSVAYGGLYNWYAVNTGKLCPTGWHVPSEDEWNTLSNFLGGDTISGGKIKEFGTHHWLSPNTDATNESGLSALASGFRTSAGGFNNIRRACYFWSSDEFNSVDGYYRFILYNYGETSPSNADKRSGFSVRCIKDNTQGK